MLEIDKLERIESPANPKIKLAAKLHVRKHRRKEQMFIAEGVRLVEMAAASDWPFKFSLVTEKALQQQRTQAIVEKLMVKNCPIYLVSEDIYDKAADTITPQGLLLVLEIKLYTFKEMINSNGRRAPLIAVLDGVQDPGNAGTIIRTADALGCSGVVCLENTTDIFADKAVRSTMGSLFNLPIIEDMAPDELAEICAQNEIRIIATALDHTAVSHFNAEFVSPVAVVFGNEGAGLTKEMLDNAQQKVFIPMCGKAESLNVASAAAIILYEAYRQREIL